MRCRSCFAEDLQVIFDLGPMPLSNAFLFPEQLEGAEPRYPLEVGFCGECTLVQVMETVPRDTIFRDDYAYYSSYSNLMVSHAKDLVEQLVNEAHLDNGSFVVEIASNDGYLLSFVRERGIRCLGVDPSGGPADVAISRGIPTRKAFFDHAEAMAIHESHGPADLILGLNVLAHVDPLDPFVKGIESLLGLEGTAVFEVPYVLDLVSLREFDTICHEHLCYFSVTALHDLFRRRGLFLNRVERTPIHGGSLRVFVGRTSNPDGSVEATMSDERETGLTTPEFYASLDSGAQAARSLLQDLIARLKEDGRSVAAYGAAGKGTVLLNYCQLGPEEIDFVADRNPSKQGRFVPGMHIPILPPEAIDEQRPDHVLVLVWNLRDEILAQLASYRDSGGKLIFPLPSPEII